MLQPVDRLRSALYRKHCALARQRLTTCGFPAVGTALSQSQLASSTPWRWPLMGPFGPGAMGAMASWDMRLWPISWPCMPTRPLRCHCPRKFLPSSLPAFTLLRGACQWMHGSHCGHQATSSSQRRVTAIAAGAQHSTALTVGGKLLVFGCNSHGALGLGNVVKCTMPTEVCCHYLLLATVLTYLGGDLVFLQVQLAALDTPLDKGDEKPRAVRVVQVQCGQLHTLILIHHSGRSLVMASGGSPIVSSDLSCCYYTINAVRLHYVP